MTDGGTEGQDDPTAVLAAPAGDADSRRSVLLLGADELARELAIALGRLGARVIIAEEYPHAPAHGVADQSVIIALADPADVSKVVQRLRPDVVVAASDTVAGDALDAVASGPGGHRPEVVPGARAVRLAADREGLRRLAADELGLPTAPFWTVGSAGELEAVGAHAGYPLVVKPVSGPLGRGQSVVTGRDDVGPAWQRAVSGGQLRALAESVVEVEHYVTLLAVRVEGPSGPSIEFCSPIGHRDPGAGVSESWQPQKLSEAATDAARSIAARIVKALGGTGVFGVELMVNGDEVYFADVSARPRDSAWVTLRGQRLSAFELQARAILGLPVDTVMVSPAAARAVTPTAAPSAAALSRALDVPESDVLVSGRAYQALATAPDVAAARERAGEVAHQLADRHPPA